MARKKKIISLPDEAEAAIEDVVSQAVDYVDYLMEALMPDGRPFGMETKPVEEQITEYIEGGYRVDPEACKNKIRVMVGQINTLLMGFGIPPEQAAAVMPYDIAETAALTWSAEMEKLLKEKAAQPLAPTADAESASILSR